jgi:hypothetical protein
MRLMMYIEVLHVYFYIVREHLKPKTSRTSVELNVESYCISNCLEIDATKLTHFLTVFPSFTIITKYIYKYIVLLTNINIV